MYNLKKLLSGGICAAMLLGVLASCGGEPAVTDTTDAASGETTPAETEPQEVGRDAVHADLPDGLNFGGETITVLTRSAEKYLAEFQMETADGDIVNDALYERNIYVQEKLGLELEIVARDGAWGQHTAFMSNVRQEVMAGDNTYDLISFYAYCNPMLSIDGVYMNLYDVENLDLTKPYWHQNMVENTAIYGKLYTVTGDIVLSAISDRTGMYFNKAKAEEYLPDLNLYEVVESGKWTHEYFGNLVKDVYNDVNGDTVKDENDFYGWDANSALDSWPSGAGLTYTKTGSDGRIEWDYLNERNTNIIETFYVLCQEKGVFFIDKADSKRFLNGKNLFYGGSLGASANFRDMADDYGILPMPKYDEDQEMYMSGIGDNYSQIGVPITCEKTEKVGAFLELMAEQSYKYVTPAYFETALKVKYMRDDEASRMLDLIIEGAYYDFGVTYTSVLGNPVYTTRQSMYHISGKNFATLYAEKESELKTSLDELMSKFGEE